MFLKYYLITFYIIINIVFGLETYPNQEQCLQSCNNKDFDYKVQCNIACRNSNIICKVLGDILIDPCYIKS